MSLNSKAVQEEQFCVLVSVHDVDAYLTERRLLPSILSTFVGLDWRSRTCLYVRENSLSSARNHRSKVSLGQSGNSNSQ